MNLCGFVSTYPHHMRQNRHIKLAPTLTVRTEKHKQSNIRRKTYLQKKHFSRHYRVFGRRGNSFQFNDFQKLE